MEKRWSKQCHII